MQTQKEFAGWVINLGFIVGLGLAVYCLVTSGSYLNQFLVQSNTGLDGVIQNVLAQAGKTPPALTESKGSDPATLYYLAVLSRLTMARYALLSCGVYAGLAFGFLGFALFLIGIRGEMDAEASKEGYSVKVARIAPGVFVLLCATVLIGFCIAQKTNFDLPGTPTVLTMPPASATGTPAAGAQATPKGATSNLSGLGGERSKPHD